MRRTEVKNYNVLFALILVIGIGLCIGGIFVPPLLIPGGILLTGAMTMAAKTCGKMYTASHSRGNCEHAEAAPAVATDHERRGSDVSHVTYVQNNNMLFVYNPNRADLHSEGVPTRPATPALEGSNHRLDIV